MSVLWLRPDQTVLSPAQDHRLLQDGLGELAEVHPDLAGEGVVLAVTPRHCEVVVLVLPQPIERVAGLLLRTELHLEAGTDLPTLHLQPGLLNSWLSRSDGVCGQFSSTICH